VHRRFRGGGRRTLFPAVRRAVRRITVVVAVAALTLGLAVVPARADSAVHDAEMQQLRAHLFAASMRAKARKSGG